jgi:hypothetical protein
VLLARDGTVQVYGDGEDPEQPWYRFQRTIDYGSAVCMMIRTTTFLGLGGFDEVYAPAYYEDTDLCMRLAQDGMEVVYEPRATVTHVRYGSGTLALATELSERNRKIFAERWSAQLSGRPSTFARAGDQVEIAARDASARPRALIWARSDGPGAEEAIRGLLEGWPRARLTWVTGAAGAGLARWREAGVEVIDDGDSSWLARRLFHYDVVLVGDDCDAESQAAIHRTQPQAPQVSLESLTDPARALNVRLTWALARAGVAPPTGAQRSSAASLRRS